ncbi:MAG TPA: iron-sulfur cluster assembly scaffold protein [Candidatus Cloacimonadota bacterium]|jgi:nitrogen fixation NifU-like protein|nr:iron-sulfur cluster assembly scaffold protein [Candidatus Cloacimonadota bacterium]
MQYSQKVLDHFMHPHNVGKLDDANVTATEGSPACGDQVTFYLKINEESHVIEEIAFQSYGCASNIATASIVTDLVKGKTIEEAKTVSWKDATNELDGLPPVKMHCSVLAVDTLRLAIKKYELEHGLREPEPFTKETIIEELRSVIYPKAGEDIITLKMVKYVRLEEGVVTLDLDIPKFDDHRQEVVNEVREHLEKYPEIKDIQITLS